MGRRLLTAVLVTLLLGTAGIARADDEGGPMADSATLRGTVSLTQTGRLPDGAVLTVALVSAPLKRASQETVFGMLTRLSVHGWVEKSYCHIISAGDKFLTLLIAVQMFVPASKSYVRCCDNSHVPICQRVSGW